MIAKKCVHIALIPLPYLLLSLILSFLHYIFLPFVFLLLIIQLFFIFFFRDPYRKIEDGIVSPADGIVMENGEKVSIFMNLWNVHVNRMPISGKILEVDHTAGRHSPAFREKGENERLSIKIETEIGIVEVIQIAGMIARRIVPYVKKGDVAEKGEKIGIVRFGSKVEVYMPGNANINITVKKGDKIKAGQTIGIYK
ncbi:MAG: phosphatidylserine decarboxylase [Candidatus Thermoplasmatota archaeon]|nr:phosphatidylserine decarboxylase [Candidatus Thermoplasmatota archaeon]